MKATRTYFPALDAIRSIACYFPITTHLFWERISGYWISLPDLQGWPLHILAFFFGNAMLGVRLFMVLSGFLITFLMLREWDGSGRFSLKNFYMRRILRIWPCYFAVVVYVFGIYPLIKLALGYQTPLHERLWPYLTFLANFELLRLTSSPGLYPNSQLSLLWSVAIEEQFYLLWPMLLILGGAAGLRWGGFVFWLLAWASQIYFRHDLVAWSDHTLPCFLYLSSGSLMACAYFYQAQSIERFFQRLGYAVTLALTLVFCTLLFGVGVKSLSSPDWLPLYGPVTAFFCGWLMLSQISFQGHRLALSAIRPLLWFSKYTYGVYIYHRIAQWWVHQIALKLGFNPTHLPTGLFLAALSVVASIALAYLSFHTLEAYFLKRKHRYSPFQDTGTKGSEGPHTAPT